MNVKIVPTTTTTTTTTTSIVPWSGLRRRQKLKLFVFPNYCQTEKIPSLEEDGDESIKHRLFGKSLTLNPSVPPATMTRFSRIPQGIPVTHPAEAFR